MKVTNWRKKLAAAIVAAGISVSGVAHAVNIPIPDADFNTFNTASNGGYAYANLYRFGGSKSPWSDDFEHNSGAYFQDEVHSNWLYNADYSDTPSNYQAAPRGGPTDQAMHGFYKYNAQELADVFQADTTYTFSIWAQGDSDADINDAYADSVFLYIFDGDGAPFTEGGSLTQPPHKFKGGLALGPGVDFVNRAGSDHADSMNNKWTQLSISYYVPNDSSHIGNHIGVGFYVGVDAAVDDASLTAVPEPTTMILVGMGGLSLLGFRRRSS